VRAEIHRYGIDTKAISLKRFPCASQASPNIPPGLGIKTHCGKNSRVVLHGNSVVQENNGIHEIRRTWRDGGFTSFVAGPNLAAFVNRANREPDTQ